MKTGPKLGVSIILIVLLVILIVQNVTVTTLRLFFWEVPSPVIAVVLVSLMAGFIVGLLTGLPMKADKKKPGGANADAPGDKQNKPVK